MLLSTSKKRKDAIHCRKRLHWATVQAQISTACYNNFAINKKSKGTKDLIAEENKCYVHSLTSFCFRYIRKLSHVQQKFKLVSIVKGNNPEGRWRLQHPGGRGCGRRDEAQPSRGSWAQLGCWATAALAEGVQLELCKWILPWAGLPDFIR